MPTKRHYASNAQRQAAYRARHADRKPATEAELAMLARSLHVVLEEALEAGRCPWPAHLLGGRAEATLRNVIRYLENQTDPGRKP